MLLSRLGFFVAHYAPTGWRAAVPDCLLVEPDPTEEPAPIATESDAKR